MKIIVNQDPLTNEYEFSRVYPLVPDGYTDEQAKRLHGASYGICLNPIKKTVVITGCGSMTIEEIERWAKGMLIACEEARAIAKEKGLGIG